MSQRLIEVVMLNGEYNTIVPYSESEYDRLQNAIDSCEAIEFVNIDGITYKVGPGRLDLLIEWTPEALKRQRVRIIQRDIELEQLENSIRKNTTYWD